MIYLISMALFVVLFGFAPKESGLQAKNHKGYLIVSGTLMTLMMGLRSRYTGSGDTYIYTMTFETLSECLDFKDYFDLYLNDTDFILSETGFYWLVWLLTRVTQEPQWMIFLTSAFICIAVCIYIHKNSEDPPMAMMIYVCLGLFTFNMNGMRQAMAMSVCVLGYELVKKRKLIPFLLTILLAMQFHKTAIAFLPVFFIPNLKNTKGNWFIYACGMVVFLLLLDQIFVAFNSATGKEYDINDSIADGGGMTVIFIYLLALALPLLMPDSINKPYVRYAMFGVLTGFGIYCARYISNQVMERVSYYYFYFLLILIPNVMKGMEDQEQKVVRVLFVLASIALFAYRTYSGSFRYFELFF